MSDLVLEVNASFQDLTPTLHAGDSGGTIVMTPPIDETYWLFRVKLSGDQAIVGFKKFFTIGIGFAKEEDWNTNLPYTCDADRIFAHIAHNKGSDVISDADCVAAIRMVQEAAKSVKDRG